MTPADEDTTPRSQLEAEARERAERQAAALAASADPVGDGQAAAAEQTVGLNGGPPEPDAAPAAPEPMPPAGAEQLPEGRWVVGLETVEALTSQLESQMRTQAVLTGIAMGVALLAVLLAAKAGRAAAAAAGGTFEGAGPA